MSPVEKPPSFFDNDNQHDELCRLSPNCNKKDQEELTNEENAHDDVKVQQHRRGGLRRRRGRRRAAAAAAAAKPKPAQRGASARDLALARRSGQISGRGSSPLLKGAKGAPGPLVSVSSLVLLTLPLLLVLNPLQFVAICSPSSSAAATMSSSSATNRAHQLPGKASREATQQPVPVPVPADSGVEAGKFVRSSAATPRNLQLLSRLESTLQPADYQLFYPELALAEDAAAAEAEADSADRSSVDGRQPADVSQSSSSSSSGLLTRKARQGNLRQSSVVQGASNWLQPTTGSPNQAVPFSTLATPLPPPPDGKQQQQQQQTKANQVLGHYNRTNVVIKAFNYKLRLDLELNNNLFGPNLIQRHLLPKGTQQISTQKLEHCYYHASTQPGARPAAIGAFRTCNGLSGIIHVDNESFVIHPLNDPEKKYPHMIYRATAGPNQQSEQQPVARPCGNTRLHQWALRHYPDSDSNFSGGDGNNNNVTSIAGGAREPQRKRYQRNDSAASASASRDDRLNHHQRQQQQANEVEQNDTKATSGQPAKSSSIHNDHHCDTHEHEQNSSASSQPAEAAAKSSETIRAAAAAAAGEEGGAKEYRSKKFTRDVGLKEKFIELALILSQDMFDKRNASSRTEVLHDSIQIINCLDLYFRYSANTRVALIYLETWAHGDQIDMSSSQDAKQILYNLLDYTTRSLYRIQVDATHLLTGGHAHPFDANEMGMSIPDSICSTRAVSVSQEASIFEPFVAASTMAHMLGHNLGMEHDDDDDDKPVHQAATSELYTGNEHPSSSGVRQSPSWPATGQPAPSRQKSPKQQAEAQEWSEEHDDELKSRSLMDSDLVAPDAETSLDEHKWLSTSEGRSRFLAEPEQWCTTNCLMSESFSYTEPPVKLGNMIQQQVAAVEPSNGNGSVLAMFSASVQALEPAEGRREQTAARPDWPHSSQQPPSAPGRRQLPFRFSRKSVDKYNQLLRSHRGVCLFNKPNKLEDFKACGNGIVDRGEDCDCGSFEECERSGDTCCDPVTCQFRGDAQCINGPCCERCKLRPRGLVCRRARGECDLPELCDGESEKCPADVHKRNGLACANSTGFCYLGQCPSHDSQCADLWGPEARKAHRHCYSTYNTNGSALGNCGQEQPRGASPASLAASSLSSSSAGKKLRRCEQENMMCGTLQCQMGYMKPSTVSSGGAGSNSATASNDAHQAAEYSTKVIQSLDGSSHECKIIIAQSASPQASYVRDGTKCGQNRVCSNRTCQLLERVYRDSIELCPKDERGRQCSGNGICSTAHKCHCEPGWHGHDCSQRLAATTTTSVGAASGVGAGLDQVKSAHSALLEPVNSPTELTTRQLTVGSAALAGPHLEPHAGPSATTAAAAVPPEPATDATIAAMVVVAATATTTTTTTLSPPPSPSPSPTTTTTTNQVDKKKHDALGAPTLVFILVSIVAAVYVGFALMANCYRRKGFIKPDKVLRHHQMNCKLDALRSSFIAKRLAEAGVAGSFDQHSNSTSLMQPPAASILSADPSAFGANPNLFAQAPASAQFAMQEAMPMQAPYDSARGPQPRGFLPSAFRRYPFSGLRNAPALSANKQPLQAAAQVHYFDAAAAAADQELQFQHQHQPSARQLGGSGRRLDYSLDYPNESCDHIPLLMASAGQQHGSRHQPTMRPAKAAQQQQQQQRNYPPAPLDAKSMRARSMSRQANRPNMANGINRATSLGSVNARQEWHNNTNHNSYNLDVDDSEDQADERGQSGKYAHRALATPLRTARGYRVGQPGTVAPPVARYDDSLSGASSPEHGLGQLNNWARPQENFAPSHSSFAAGGANSLARQHSNPKRPSGYHSKDLLMGARHELGDDDDDDDLDDLRLTPPPPPPQSGAGRHLHHQQADDQLLVSTEEEEAESGDLSTVVPRQQQLGQAKRQSEAELVKKSPSPPVWMRQKVKRIPLNNTGQDDDNGLGHNSGQLGLGAEQVSLLSQLQQLEQVQSLHQRQVAGQQHKPEAATLHEFFSLPLSVQLSALLARSLQTPPANQASWQTTPIDEYLNTLNSSSVATMSRRSFKEGSAKQPQPVAAAGASSRGGTLKRQQQQQQQQMKLQNLQSLINRLQKLHQHQQRQQHQIQCDGQAEPDDDLDNELQTESVYEAGLRPAPRSRPSTLGRGSMVSSSSQRGLMETTDDALIGGGGGSRRRPISRRSPADNRGHESAYSMSDSEDGANYAASRVFRPNFQQQRKSLGTATAVAAAATDNPGETLAQAEATEGTDKQQQQQQPSVESQSASSQDCPSQPSDSNTQSNDLGTAQMDHQQEEKAKS